MGESLHSEESVDIFAALPDEEHQNFKAVIPASDKKIRGQAPAGIQNWTGCRIKSGMTFNMFNYRTNMNRQF